MAVTAKQLPITTLELIFEKLNLSLKDLNSQNGIDNILKSPLQMLSCGSRNAVFLDKDGGVSLCGYGPLLGSNNNELLTYTDVKNRTLIPVPIECDAFMEPGKKVTSIAAGDEHIIFLCENGNLFSCGTNRNGELGDGRSSIYCNSAPTPIQCNALKGKTVTKVAAGSSHTILLCADGTLFSWGQGIYGQLGHGDTKNRLVPTQIQCDALKDKKVIDIAAGRFCTILLCEDGSVFSFGEVYHSFNNSDKKSCLIPMPIECDAFMEPGQKVLNIAVGSRHILFLCENHRVFSYGYGTNGQLGHGDTKSLDVPTPIQCDALKGKKVIKVAAGTFTSILICEDGSVFSCGRGDNGQLGHGDTKSPCVPTPIQCDALKEKKVIDAAAGCYHTILSCEDGSVFSCGSWYAELIDNDIEHLSPKQMTNPYHEATCLRRLLLEQINILLTTQNQPSEAKISWVVAKDYLENRFCYLESLEALQKMVQRLKPKDNEIKLDGKNKNKGFTPLFDATEIEIASMDNSNDNNNNNNSNSIKTTRSNSW